LRAALACVLLIALTATATATVVLEQVHKVAVALAQSPRIVAPGSLTPDQPDAPQTILVVGSDKRAQSTVASDRAAGANTDTLLLVRMDPSRSQTSVLSIPRDLRVTIHTDGGAPVTTKINAAYSMGGDPLLLRTVRQTLHIAINHVVDVDFAGFVHIVDAVGCVYIDVDHRYFHSNAGLPPSLDYSAIDLQPGYQRLCGAGALSYVRYRHTDSDLVRVARQQDFVRQMKDQVGIGTLLARRDTIANVVGRNVSTDIRGTQEVLRMAKLVGFSLGRPIRQVPFRYSNADAVIGGVDYVTATSADVHRSVQDFLYGDQSLRLPAVHPATQHAPSGGGQRSGAAASAPAAPTPAAPDTTPVAAADRATATAALAHLPFAAFYPRLQVTGATQQDVRAYTLRDEAGNVHHAYRVVWDQNAGAGQYYGIEGTDWLDPPIVAHPSQTLRTGGRTLLLFTNGGHIRLVAWRTSHALYWLANTLTDSLSNSEMLTLATSARG
jgi:LCP family protein required for cell wall assembly